MPNDKNTSKETKESTPTEKPKKVPVLTIAGVFQKVGQEGAKDRKELATKIIDFLASKGVKKNVRGHEIKSDRVLQQISAMIRDINENEGKGRGADKGSWWSKYKVVENDKGFKLVLKA